MEENKDEIIYDLQSEERSVESGEPMEDVNSEDSDDSGAAVGMTASHKEIERMVEEMGAETLLDIIRDNRNAAIRQIISEVESSRDRTLSSGGSAPMNCSSIFDLAALA